MGRRQGHGSWRRQGYQSADRSSTSKGDMTRVGLLINFGRIEGLVTNA